jgi:hypothetical protein
LPNKDGRPRIRVQRHGKCWLAKSRQDWFEECRVSPKQYDRAIKNLRAREIVEVVLHKFNGVPIHHISVNWSKLVGLIRQKSTTDSAESGIWTIPPAAVQASPEDNIDFDQREKSLTETTAEITTENIQQAGSTLAVSNLISSPEEIMPAGSPQAFAIPSLREVTEYFQKFGYPDAAQKAGQFYQKYSSANWTINCSAIRDWRKLADGWKKNWNRLQTNAGQYPQPGGADKLNRMFAMVERSKKLKKL